MMELDGDIPGATPLGDISGIRIREITTREQLYEAEFRNTAKAISKYLARRPSVRSAPFTRDWVFRLHKEMFGDVWEWAGKKRQGETNVGIEPHRIEPAVEDLLRDLWAWKDSDMDFVEHAARLHHRSVEIHPFENGNGRWARLLANIWLKQCRTAITEWPEGDMVDGTSVIRDEYLDALKRADNHDYNPLIELHKRYTPTGT